MAQRVAKRLAWRRFPTYFNIVIGILAALGIGEAGAHAQGLTSMGLVVLLVFWLFGTVAVPTRPRHLVVAILTQSVAMALPSVVRGATDGLALYAIGALAGGGLFIMAAVQREHVEVEMFVARTRLAVTNQLISEQAQHLSSGAADLERRVTAQLQRVVEKRRQMQRLQREVEGSSGELAPSPVAGAAVALKPGDVLGDRVRIAHPLASGGFGDVYLAEDLATGTEVVAKVMRCDEDVSIAKKRRFVLEAAAAVAVRHAAVVRVLHVDLSADGRPYLLCERIDGVTLRWCVDATALSPVQCYAAMIVVVDALRAVHAAGIVHRDIKPDNLMLCRETPFVKLLDFGVSRWTEDAERDLTAAGEFVGTVAYMAPEQLEAGRNVGPPADVHGLGCTLFECLAGEPPLGGLGPIQAVRKRLCEAMPPLASRAPLVDRRACALVDRMLDGKPEVRPTLDEVEAALRALLPPGAAIEDLLAGCLPERSPIARGPSDHVDTVSAASAVSPLTS